MYRWRVHPGKEAAFEQAWREITVRIREERGGLGSRLHRCADGSFVGYAQWPDRETWAASQALPFPPNEASTVMRDAIASSDAPLELTPIADLLS